MASVFQWLFDLENIRIGRDAPLSLKWQSALPAWQIACCALAAVIVLMLIYRREQASATKRIVLGVVRFMLIALIVAVLCEPTLVLQRNRVEPAYVAVLVDGSMSMASRDVYADEALAAAMARGAGLAGPAEVAAATRLDLARRTLLRDDAAPLSALMSHNGVQLFTFASGIRSSAFIAGRGEESDVAPFVDAVQAIEADGQASDLSGSLTHVIGRAQGRRLAAIVLLSDGQSTESASLSEAVDLASGRQVPIFPLRIGSPIEPKDIEVGPVRAMENVFANDLVAVEADVQATGLTEPTAVNLTLIDERTNQVVAAQTVTLDPGAPRATVELRTKAAQVGATRYRVEAEALPQEQNLDNNADFADVSVLDDQLRLLYVEGYPRFEYRYLKNAMLREHTMRLSVLLLEADEQFVQEGTDPIRRFPETPEELADYDVVLFGDVDPRSGWLSTTQMNMLVDFVGTQGGGFGLIAGERSAPERFAGTPLERLIPVRIDPGFTGRYDAAIVDGFHLELTPEGASSRIFRFARDPADSLEVFEQLPELFWVARTLGPKPGASVLAEHPSMQTPAGPLPVVVTGRYGSGRLFFQATDDIWRWRRHTGELLVDTYWIQVARELLRADRSSRERRFVVRSDRRNYPYAMPVQAQIEFYDSDLLADQGESVPLVVSDADGLIVTRLEARRLAPESSVFEASFVPPRIGRFAIRASDLVPRPGEREAAAAIRVDKPDLEARRPEANHQALQRLADGTGGKMIEPDEMTAVLASIPDRSVQIPDDVTEPLWDSKLVIILFVLMISVEWLIRKASGML
jgi:hypothetical protein